MLGSVLVLTIALAACGESTDSGESATADDGSDDSDPPEADAPDEPETDPSDDGSSNGNYAIVTVGSTTYEIPADPLNLCNNFDNLIFGSFATDAGGQVVSAGGPDASLQINFGVPVTDWEDQGLQAPTMNVDLNDDGVRWFASTELGQGSVDSWTLDDGKAEGQASFVGTEAGSGAEVGSAAGSFEVVCR